jgi:non-canonical (house-cleaning) NTP pyrophosphatase
MRGARQRVDALTQTAANANESYQFYVGLEGGLDVCNRSDARSDQGQDTTSRCVFLESWAYVFDGSRGCFGRSGAIELPETLAHEVLDQGVELATAIDRFAGMAGVRDGQGAWGVLSRDLITRRDAFCVALLAGFAPFYNARLYRAARAAG